MPDLETNISVIAKEFLDDESIYRARIDGSLVQPHPSYKLIDLFSGAGGLTLGFSREFGHSFEPIWANDVNRDAVRTYNHNFGLHCVKGDLKEILRNNPNVIPRADIVVGGPPCQGFSLLNKRRKGDKRKSLWKPFMDVVKLSRADVFLMENVPQLLDSYEYGEIIDYAELMGFKTRSAKLFAVDYGVAQKRQRAFILGCKFADPNLFFPPKKTHFEHGENEELDFDNSDYIGNPSRWVTLRDIISDLPEPQGTEIREIPPPLDIHFGRNPTSKTIKRFKAIPDEGMNRFDLMKNAPDITPMCWINKKSGGTDLFGRLWWDRPAFTIRTEFFKPEKGRYIHPIKHRPITHREAARIQSFPDSFVFRGSKIEIARQIGNAVPPLLAARLADCVYGLMQFKNK